MKVLLIEDSQALADNLKRHLSQNFIVEYVRTAAEGLDRSLSGAHDLIIIGSGQESVSGYKVCQTVRSNNVKTPILILTNPIDVPNRVALLEAGADDCMVRPFNMAELKARLFALLRRSPVYQSDIARVGDLVVDPVRRRVRRAESELNLRRKEFDILEYLIRNQGKPVSRAAILDHAWDSSKDIWNNTVDVHIKLLRDKIDRPFKAKLIKTVHGIGYMIDEN